VFNCYLYTTPVKEKKIKMNIDVQCYQNMKIDCFIRTGECSITVFHRAPHGLQLSEQSTPSPFILKVEGPLFKHESILSSHKSNHLIHTRTDKMYYKSSYILTKFLGWSRMCMSLSTAPVVPLPQNITLSCSDAFTALRMINLVMI